jgi:hypothetical protein
LRRARKQALREHAARKLKNSIKNLKPLKHIKDLAPAAVLGLAASGMGNYCVTGRGIYNPNQYRGNGEYSNGEPDAVTNSLIAGKDVPFEVPTFESAGDETGSVTISRKEYLTDIYAAGEIDPTTGQAINVFPFVLQKFAINPGIESSFPWLSQVAQNYDEYEINQLIYSFRSTTTDIGSATTGQCGTIIMCTNYNVNSAVFRDKINMLEYDGAMSAKTTESMIHGVECDPEKNSGPKGKYIRAAGANINQNLMDYDLANFQIAVANTPTQFAGQSLGELWVTYTVTLRKPKFFTGKGYGITQDIYVTSQGNLAKEAPLGQEMLLLNAAQNSLQTKVTLNQRNRIGITFPGSYGGSVEIMLTVDVAGGTFIGTGWIDSFNFGGNVVPILDIYGTMGSLLPKSSFQAPVTGTNGTYVFIAHVNTTPSSLGYDNTFFMNFNPSALQATQGETLNIKQSSLTIREYNTSFSGRANNIGPIGTQTDAPILTNTNGVNYTPGVNNPTTSDMPVPPTV